MPPFILPYNAPLNYPGNFTLGTIVPPSWYCYVDSNFPFLFDIRGGTVLNPQNITGVTDQTGTWNANGTFNNNSLMQFNATQNFTSGSNTTFASDSNLDILPGASVLINTDVYFQNQSNVQFYGEVDGYATLNWNNPVNLYGQVITTGGLLVASASTLEVTSGSYLQLDDGSTTTINGDINLNSTSYFTMDGTMNVVGSGVVNVQTGTSLNMQTGSAFTVQSGASFSIASGTSNSLAVGSVLQAEGTILNSGNIVTASGGVVAMQAGSTFSCQGSFTINVGTTATFNSNTTFNSLVTCDAAFISNVSTWCSQAHLAGVNVGQVFPTGGTYTCSPFDYAIYPSASTCNVTLNSSTPGAQYMVVNINGTQTINVYAPAGSLIAANSSGTPVTEPYLACAIPNQSVIFTFNANTNLWTYTRSVV